MVFRVCVSLLIGLMRSVMNVRPQLHLRSSHLTGKDLRVSPLELRQAMLSWIIEIENVSKICC